VPSHGSVTEINRVRRRATGRTPSVRVGPRTIPPSGPTSTTAYQRSPAHRRYVRAQRAVRKTTIARLAAHYPTEFQGLSIGTGSKTDPAWRMAQQILSTKRSRTINRLAELGKIEHPDMPHGLVSVIGDLIPDTPAEIAFDAGVAASGGALGAVGAAAKGAKIGSEVAKSIERVRDVARGTRIIGPRRALAGTRAIGRAERAAGRVRGAVARDVGRGAEAVGKRTPESVKTAARATGKAAQKGWGSAAGRAARKTTRVTTAPARHPGKATLAANVGPGVVASAQSGHPSDILAPAEGYYRALTEHPGKTLGTTARAIPGLLTAPIGIAANLGLTGGRAVSEAAHEAHIPGARGYSGREITAPTRAQAKAIADFAAGMAKTFGSGDPKRIQQAIESEYGLTPLAIAGIPGVKALRDAGAGEALSRGVRRASETRTGRATGLARAARKADAIKAHKHVARLVSAAQRRGEAEAAGTLHPMVRSLRRAERRHKGVKGRVRAVVGTLTEEGITNKRHLAEAIKAHGGRPADVPAERIVTADVLAEVAKRPQLLRDPDVRAAVEHFRTEQRNVETSQVAKNAPQALTWGVKLPDARLAQLASKRYGREFTRLKPKSPKRAQILAEMEQRYGKQVEGEFLADMRRLRAGQLPGKEAAKGLAEPAWTHHGDVFAREKQNLVGTPHGLRGRSSYNVSHRRENKLREKGAIDRSWEALAQGSIISPRMKRAVNENTARITEQMALRFGVGKKGRLTKVVTARQLERLAAEGKFDPKRHAALDAQGWKSAILDPASNTGSIAAFERSVESHARELYARAGKGDRTAKGLKYVIFERPVLDEFLKQHRGLQEGKVFGKLQRASSVALLGFSPTWLMLQPLAEGAQALAAVNPVRMVQGLRAYKQLSSEAKRQFDANIGGTSGLGSIQDAAISLDGDLAGARTRMGRALERSRPGRAVHGLLTGHYSRTIDRTKGTAIRRAVAAGHLAREYGAFRSGLRKLMRGSESIAREMEGKSLREQLNYFAKNPEARLKIEKYTDSVMGNWTALTHNERVAGHLVIFFPFVRMSVEWVFHTFPREHPLKAAALNFLAQENADQLKRALRGDPSFFSDWASAPLYSGEGGAPGGLLPLSRVAPGANTLVEAVGQDAGSVAGYVRALNPFIGGAISAVEGTDPLTGRSLTGGEPVSIPQALGIFGATLAALPAPVRWGDLIADRKVSNFLKGKDTSDLSRLFAAIDEPKGAKLLRSTIAPLMPRDVAREALKAHVGRLVDAKYGDNKDAAAAASAELDQLYAQFGIHSGSSSGSSSSTSGLGWGGGGGGSTVGLGWGGGH
jgi:hypothetical protein